MKRLIFILIMVPFISLSQEKNVVHYSRYFIKPGTGLNFEKAITDHIAKYHSTKLKWRVFKIMSGPDAGGYQMVEGPMAWDDIDIQGDLDRMHQMHWNTTVANMLEAPMQQGYILYRAELSTIPLTDYSNKIAVNHIFLKPGYTSDMEEAIKKIKKSWEQNGNTVAVYESSSSGPTQFLFVTRYKQGLRERNIGYRKMFKEAYIQANGDNSYDDYLKSIRTYVDHSWSELLFYHPEYSSK